MDKKKIIRSVLNQYRRSPVLLWVLFATAVILMNLGTMAYASDDTIGSSQLEHSLVVRNWKGEYIGTSHHVVLDPSARKIVFVIVSLEKKENAEIKEIAVPWNLFSIDRENGVLVLSISRKQLDSAPEYHASDLDDPEFVGRIYHFFALAPPWAEETPKGKGMGLEF